LAGRYEVEEVETLPAPATVAVTLETLVGTGPPLTVNWLLILSLGDAVNFKLLLEVTTQVTGIPPMTSTIKSSGTLTLFDLEE
jgi:hypothetical protein